MSCLNKIQPIQPPYCSFCGAPTPQGLERSHCRQCADQAHPFGLARAYGLYEGNLKRLVHVLKFYGYKDVAPFLGELLALGYRQYPELREYELILPVPISIERQKERGFNQSELLAAFLSLKVHRPYRSDLLIRSRNTAPLFSMKKEEREKELEQAFTVNQPEKVRNKHLLLVDDIYTSGATAAACAHTLLACGAASVGVYTLCKDLL